MIINELDVEFSADLSVLRSSETKNFFIKISVCMLRSFCGNKGNAKATRPISFKFSHNLCT